LATLETAVRNELVGRCMMYLTMICTHITLLAVCDFLRFNSLDGLLFGAIDSAAVDITSDSVVIEDESLVCWQDVELVMLVADGPTYINPGGFHKPSRRQAYLSL
jgi:hypothetical protein